MRSRLFLSSLITASAFERHNSVICWQSKAIVLKSRLMLIVDLLTSCWCSVEVWMFHSPAVPKSFPGWGVQVVEVALVTGSLVKHSNLHCGFLWKILEYKLLLYAYETMVCPSTVTHQ